LSREDVQPALWISFQSALRLVLSEQSSGQQAESEGDDREWRNAGPVLHDAFSKMAPV
jgi:hypothetical protein